MELIYPLVMANIANWKMTIEIVDIPNKHGDVPVRYLNLPEGIHHLRNHVHGDLLHLFMFGFSWSQVLQLCQRKVYGLMRGRHHHVPDECLLPWNFIPHTTSNFLTIPLCSCLLQYTMCVHIWLYLVYIYIYTHRGRERERDRFESVCSILLKCLKALIDHLLPVSPCLSPSQENGFPVSWGIPKAPWSDFDDLGIPPWLGNLFFLVETPSNPIIIVDGWIMLNPHQSPWNFMEPNQTSHENPSTWWLNPLPCSIEAVYGPVTTIDPSVDTKSTTIDRQ